MLLPSDLRYRKSGATTYVSDTQSCLAPFSIDCLADEEFDRIREVVERYQYIAMDTEFPGIVARPTGNFLNTNEYNYQTIKCNVDLLKVIQLGVTFADSHGNLPPGTSTWQFNFRFNLESVNHREGEIAMTAPCPAADSALSTYGLRCRSGVHLPLATPAAFHPRPLALPAPRALAAYISLRRRPVPCLA